MVILTRNKIAIVIPLSNEEDSFELLRSELNDIMSCNFYAYTVYFILDKSSKDNTYNLCKLASSKDSRFKTIFLDNSKCVVDAYLGGFKIAYYDRHDYYIEMDAGLSHLPSEVPMFIKYLAEGYDCVFGSRFIKGGVIKNGTLFRFFLSKMGTYLSNIFLGTKYYDATSGFQGFNDNTIKLILSSKLKSRGHFYQTEIRYILKNKKFIEVPIKYSSPSPRVSYKSIINSLVVLFYYSLNK